MVPRVKDNNPLGTQKTVSLDFDEEMGSWGPPGELQIFKIDHILLHVIVAAVTWLKYCRYGVKFYPINQSFVRFQRYWILFEFLSLDAVKQVRIDTCSCNEICHF